MTGPSDAPSIVFVHGAVFTRSMWSPQRRALSDRYRIVVPDLPGHGARAAEPFRLESAVSRVGEAVESVAGDEVLLVGLSLGGYVATEYASRRSEHVDGLVLSGSSANPVGGMGLVTRAVGGLARLAARSDRVEGAVERLAERWVRDRGLPADVVSEIVDAGFFPRPFGEAGPFLAGRDFRRALAAYAGPSLVLNGEADTAMRRGEEAHTAAARDGRLTVVDDAGHVCNLHRPDAYTAAVRTFGGEVLDG